MLSKKELVVPQNREIRFLGHRVGSCAEAKPQSLREETSCLPNGGSTLKNTNSTNKGRSVIGTVGSCRAASLKQRGRKKRRGVEMRWKRNTLSRRSIGSSWVPTPRGSTSKLAGGRSFWNLSPSRYPPNLLSTEKLRPLSRNFN